MLQWHSAVVRRHARTKSFIGVLWSASSDGVVAHCVELIALELEAAISSFADLGPLKPDSLVPARVLRIFLDRAEPGRATLSLARADVWCRNQLGFRRRALSQRRPALRTWSSENARTRPHICCACAQT